QARAYGLGMVLATQNPVDLDYKGLSNAGLWFLGRLQTARDKARVLDGLEGAASTSGSSFNRGDVDRLLSGLGKRMFLMHSVHEDGETVFQTRWTMAYLRGPLLREEIRRLNAGTPAGVATPEAPSRDRGPAATAAPTGGPRPLLPPGVKEVFLAPEKAMRSDADVSYAPWVLGRARVRYSQPAARVDVDREVICIARASESIGESAWEASRQLPEPPEIEPAPRPGTFASLPGALASPRGYATLATSLKNHLARSSTLTVWRAPVIDAISMPEESEAEFRVRIAQRVKEWRDAELDRVRESFASRMATLTDRIERARQKVEREKAEAKNQSLQTYVSIGSAVLGALLGRKMASSTTIGKAATSMRSASRAARQQADVAHAEESLLTLEEKRAALEEQIAGELDRIRADTTPDRIALERIDVPVRKSGTSVEDVVLAWVPA
ncbi:MAG: ATP-binding protein, partial [Planctomycetia bacterium]